MTEPKWTKGPWRLRDDGEGPPFCDIETIDGGRHGARLLASTYPDCQYEPGVGYKDPAAVAEAEANAALIAASPELYETLNHLAAAVAESAGRGGRFVTGDIERALDAAAAALGKARGETP